MTATHQSETVTAKQKRRQRYYEETLAGGHSIGTKFNVSSSPWGCRNRRGGAWAECEAIAGAGGHDNRL